MTDKVRKYLIGIEKYRKATHLSKEELTNLSRDLDRLYLNMSNDEREYIERCS